jgi:hypothetical protein
MRKFQKRSLLLQDGFYVARAISAENRQKKNGLNPFCIDFYPLGMESNTVVRLWGDEDIPKEGDKVFRAIEHILGKSINTDTDDVDIIAKETIDKKAIIQVQKSLTSGYCRVAGVWNLQTFWGQLKDSIVNAREPETDQSSNDSSVSPDNPIKSDNHAL